jgi:hypothetical protein
VYDTYEMMAIEARKLGKKAIVRKLEPYDCYRVQIANGCVVMICHCPCMKNPWQDRSLEKLCRNKGDA